VKRPSVESAHETKFVSPAPLALSSTRMWRLIARPLDRFAIRSACGSVLPSPDGQSHSSEALALLRSPDFFSPAVETPQINFISKSRFEFASPIESGVKNNDLVPGRFEAAAKDWQTRPSVILLHGWNAELQYQWLCPFWAQLLARAGVNAFMFELPYHGARRPRQPIQNFLSGNLLHVMRATRQSLADLRTLATWLREQGAPSVGVWGVSLGAWLAGLAAAHQPEIDLGVMVTPVVRMDRALRDLPFCDAIRDDLRGLDEEFRPLNLVTHPARLTSDRMLVVASELDLFAPGETIDELTAAWRPEVWKFQHGHISILLAAGVMRRIVKWIAARAVLKDKAQLQPIEQE
jgi:pimeloyl-ACP methyl ester carboxylesterase